MFSLQFELYFYSSFKKNAIFTEISKIFTIPEFNYKTNQKEDLT
jgi:hypothetical protein